MNAEPFEVIMWSGEPGDLQLAAVARARVDLPDRQRAPKLARDLRSEPRADQLHLVAPHDGLCDDPRPERRSKLAEHGLAARRPARLLAKLSEQRLTADQLIVEDATGHVEEVADKGITDLIADGRAFLAGNDNMLRPQHRQLLRDRRLVQVQACLELLDAVLLRAKDLKDPNANRVSKRLEELGLERLQAS
jgi:hypothetical protein